MNNKRYIKGVLFFTLFFLLSALSLTKPDAAHAQSRWFMPSKDEYSAALQQCEAGNVGLECTVQAIVSDIIWAIDFAGGDSGDLAYNSGGVQYAFYLIKVLMGNPPVSSEEFVYYYAQKMDVVRPAYAQGTGYTALSPLIPIWSAFRNIAYIAYVAIFIITGFLIMIRARLNPQTVINLQNSLPKLIITLLLITFSYAIAGFMVDLIYLGIYLLVTVFATQGIIDISQVASVQERLISNNAFTLIFKSGIWRIADDVGDDVMNIINAALGGNPFVGTVLETLFSGLVSVILKGALLFASFKLFFQLLITYIEILLQTIFSPIMILMNALPGSNSFASWARNLLANVLVFPAVAAIFLVGAALLGPCTSCPSGTDDFEITTSIFQMPGGDPGWLPPFVGLQEGVSTDAVLGLVGFGIILFAPNVVSLVKKSLKASALPTAGVLAPVAASYRTVTAPARAAASGVSSGARMYVGQKIEAFAGEGKKSS